MRATRAATSRRVEPDTILPISHKPEEIMLMVAGGAGTHSVYVPCFGNSRAVTREIVS